MKSLLLIFAVLSFCTPLKADLNGSVEYIGDIRILNLWGTWTEMGYAHGYLLAPDLKEVFEDYFLEMIGGVSNYANIRTYFLAYFDIPAEFISYSQGMISGTSDSISIFSNRLGRNLDYIDVCVVSATPDISALSQIDPIHCTSVSSWENATSGDPDLGGAPVISRNLDYYVDTGCTILDHNLLVTYDPEIGQNWISIGFPGFAGCLSGMNESGISASLNMGNNQGTTQYTSSFIPICMAQALGLSKEDFDGSGQCDVEDMKAALTEWNRCNSYDIHVVADRALAGQDSASLVIEVNNRNGFTFRYSSEEPHISPDRMILSNHHRILIPPVYCFRYNYLMDSLTTNPNVTLGRLWNFMGAVGFPAGPGSGGTIQTMIFMPEHLRTGLAFATIATPSYAQDPEWIEWIDIFPNHEPQGIRGDAHNEPAILVSPNPSAGIVTLSCDANILDASIYDTAGRIMNVCFPQQDEEGLFHVNLSSLPAGVYRISILVDDGIFSEDIIILQ